MTMHKTFHMQTKLTVEIWLLMIKVISSSQIKCGKGTLNNSSNNKQLNSKLTLLILPAKLELKHLHQTENEQIIRQVLKLVMTKIKET